VCRVVDRQPTKTGNTHRGDIYIHKHTHTHPHPHIHTHTPLPSLTRAADGDNDIIGGGDLLQHLDADGPCARHDLRVVVPVDVFDAWGENGDDGGDDGWWVVGGR
jgi:hypothetical protein